MKLIKPDYIIIIAFGLFIITHFITGFIINYHKDVAKEIKIAEQVSNIIEVNPIARASFYFDNFRYIYQMLLVPTFFFGIYYLYRKNYYNKPNILMALSYQTLFLAFLNVTNDLSVMLGLLAR